MADAHHYRDGFQPPTSDPSWLWGLRSDAMSAFERTGFPNRRVEDWKHTGLRPVTGVDWKLDAAGEPGAELPELTELVPADEGHGALLLDGILQPERSRLDGLPQGVTVLSMRDAVSQHPQWVQQHLGHIAAANHRGFVALNLAFFRDGLFVHVAKDVVLMQPITVVVATTDAHAGRATHLRHLIIAEQGAAVTVVERYIGANVSALNNVVTEVFTGPNAHVHHVKLQQESESALHVSTIDVRQQRDSRFTSHAVATGGALGRTEVRTSLRESGAECSLYGVYLGRGSQQLDQLTHVEHAVAHGRSTQLYKGVLDEDSSGIFNGMVLVQHGADDSDATQTNNNLVLSDGAAAHSRPQLEIHAEEVTCAHGSTIGALDQDALFFLRSRGLPEADARQLLTAAFADEVVQTVPEGPVRDVLAAAISGWMA